MPEGLAAPEVGKEIGHHSRHSTQEQRDRILSIAEAVLLSLVALLAGWSGYAAAKWSTESRVALAESQTAQTQANRANLEALSLRNFDSSTFEAWFAAYTAGSEPARAPRGPTYMPQYQQPELARAARLDREADDAHAAGVEAGERSDDYVRTTVFLATVLFLVGISTQFPLRGVRYGLVAVGAVLLVFSIVQLAQLPGPPE